MHYKWQQSDWPNFTYDLVGIEGELIAFADKAGQITGMLKGFEGGMNARSDGSP